MDHQEIKDSHEKILNHDFSPDRTTVLVELDTWMAAKLKVVSVHTGLSQSALITLGLQYILPEQVKALKAVYEENRLLISINGDEPFSF